MRARVSQAVLLLIGLAWAGSATAAVSVPPEVREQIVNWFNPQMLNADTTLWRFDSASPSPLGGTVYCGRVNMQNSLHEYLGFRAFYAIVLRGQVSEGAIMERARNDPTGREAFKIKALCPN